MHKLLIKVAKHSRPISIPFGTKRLKQEFSLKIHASQFLVFMLLKTKQKQHSLYAKNKTHKIFESSSGKKAPERHTNGWSLSQNLQVGPIIKTIHTSQNRHMFFFNLHRLNPTLAESRAILNIKAKALFRKELTFVMTDSSRI